MFNRFRSCCIPYIWKKTELNSVEKVFEMLSELYHKRWLCRGHSKSSWPLIPTIDRVLCHNLSRIEKLKIERKSIELFRSTVLFFASKVEQEALKNDVTTLMVMRHYGVPTRLLDWSKSPWVAAYFAVECNCNEDGIIYSFDEPLYEEKGKEQWKKWPETTVDGSGDPDKFDYNLKTAFDLAEPSDWIVCGFYKDFPRQGAQYGAYSIAARFGRDHGELIAKLLEDPNHYHAYIIKSNLKPKIQKILKENFGIWRGFLFPDTAGAAYTAKTAFQCKDK